MVKLTTLFVVVAMIAACSARSLPIKKQLDLLKFLRSVMEEKRFNEATTPSYNEPDMPSKEFVKFCAENEEACEELGKFCAENEEDCEALENHFENFFEDLSKDFINICAESGVINVDQCMALMHYFEGLIGGEIEKLMTICVDSGIHEETCMKIICYVEPDFCKPPQHEEEDGESMSLSEDDTSPPTPPQSESEDDESMKDVCDELTEDECKELMEICEKEPKFCKPSKPENVEGGESSEPEGEGKPEHKPKKGGKGDDSSEPEGEGKPEHPPKAEEGDDKSSGKKGGDAGKKPIKERRTQSLKRMLDLLKSLRH